jgi:hypothetical protein
MKMLGVTNWVCEVEASTRYSLEPEIPMSADKHKGLATRAAYLRRAASEGGLGLNVKWAARLTHFLKRMADEGEIVLRRVGSDGRGGKAVTCAFATPAGLARLAEIERRFGTGFGGAADIGRVEPCRETKEMRRKRRIAPETARAAAQRAKASRRAAALRANEFRAQACAAER